MENEYLMRKAFKYELLRDVLFNNSEISSWSDDLRFDDEKICNILKIIEPDMYEDALRRFEREER